MSTDEIAIDPAKAAELLPSLEALEAAARAFFHCYIAAQPMSQAQALAVWHAKGVHIGLLIAPAGTVDVVAIDGASQVKVIDQPRITRDMPKH